MERTVYHNISDFLGKTFVSVKKIDDDVIKFIDTEGKEYRMYHEQDCCESVYIEDINGDLNDLVGSPITLAEERSSDGIPPPNAEYEPDSYTWTFYALATVKGYVDIRWYGTSNGYYSESVTIAS